MLGFSMTTDLFRGPKAAGESTRKLWGGALASALCLLALSARCEWVGRNALVFLAWNLLLAWMPLVFNGLRWAYLTLHARIGAPRWMRAPAIAFDFAWLMFLPNAPYLVTDLIHLTARPPVPLWFDVLFFSGFAATGCWLGLVSLELVLARVKGRMMSLAAATLVCVLCGYGVFMGRFWRFNSWDILHDPLGLFVRALQPLLDPSSHRGAVAFTFGFALFFGMQLLLFAVAMSPRARATSPAE